MPSPLKKGEFIYEILENGDVKIETGDMAGAIHVTADEFIKEAERLLGGKVEHDKTKQKQGHHHHHDHDHSKGGHHHH